MGLISGKVRPTGLRMCGASDSNPWYSMWSAISHLPTQWVFVGVKSLIDIELVKILRELDTCVPFYL